MAHKPVRAARDQLVVCLTVIVPLQFRPRCTRAHTVTRRPASVSTAPPQKVHLSMGMKRSPRAWIGEVDRQRRATASMSGTTYTSRDRSGSRREVVLTLREAAHQ